MNRIWSPTDTPALPPLTLSAERLDLELLLPISSEPGPHDVRLLSAGDQVLAQASGQADIRDFVTTLRVEIDLRAGPRVITSSPCGLRGDDWSFYPRENAVDRAGSGTHPGSCAHLPSSATMPSGQRRTSPNERAKHSGR